MKPGVKFLSRKALLQFLTVFLTHLRISNFSLLLQKIYRTHNNKPWTTTGIKTSCQHKGELYLNSRDCNNPKLKVHYKSYGLILSKVIKAAKQLYYNHKISKSTKKIKTTWDITKMKTCKNHTNKGTQLIHIHGKLNNNKHSVADSLNIYFLTIADKINCNIKNDKT